MTLVPMKRADIPRAHRPYEPRGAALDLLRSKDKENLIEGPAGTGKTAGILTKCHVVAEKYHGCRILLMRKTRASLSQSVLVTFEDKVVPVDHPILDGPSRSHRESYMYPNGSEIVCAGMDRPSRIMSTEFDIIALFEATEFTVEEYESAMTRNRNFVVPYQQVLSDCNPGPPTHWLNTRPGVTRHLSRHEDNPVLHNGITWTKEGTEYIGTLDRLTGVRYKRLRLGLWVAAEGQIYEEWDPAVHYRYDHRVHIANDWPRIWGVDFGYTNPFVWQCWALDPDGRLLLEHELYYTGHLVEDAALDMLRIAGGRKPFRIVCDHDAEGRATLERKLGMRTIAADKSVWDGIQMVKARLRVQEDGLPRLVMLRDRRELMDEELVRQKKPTSTAEEIDGYVWDTSGGRRRGEEPVKFDDHGMDTMRYVVMAVDAPRRGWGAV